MSDLVGNPEARFSRVAAHMFSLEKLPAVVPYEPPRGKTNNVVSEQV